MFAPEVLNPTVDPLAELAGNGRALEFAIGTVAWPSHCPSSASLSRASNSPPWSTSYAPRPTKPSSRWSAAIWLPRPFPASSLVYLVFNIISNLLTQSEQVACFRNAARHLAPAGRFVIELWVPDLRRLPPGQQAAVSQIEPGYIGLDSYDVVHQQVVSHHIRFGEDMSAQIFRSPHPYIWPAELDLMGELGGFALESRARTGGALSSPQIPVPRVGLPPRRLVTVRASATC